MATSGQPPFFLITIDTEGDNLWAAPRRITTENARFLPRFQALCEEFGLRPTYLVNYEMAVSPCFEGFAADLLARDKGEIGMHLHAWNSPPEWKLTGDDFRHMPFLIEYPEEAMAAKIAFMTDLLRDRFGIVPISHRAGRWAMDERYARLLVHNGYQVDCSVTPEVNWCLPSNAPAGAAGTDYTGFPDDPYFLSLDDIRQTGPSGLLELPVTICRLADWSRLPTSLARRVFNRVWPERQWIRPNGRTPRPILAAMRKLLADRRPHVQFTFHSSELMPGGSPSFATVASVENLYRDLRAIFAFAAANMVPATLAEFRAGYADTPACGPESAPGGSPGFQSSPANPGTVLAD